jgi:molecular chaperone DnaK
MTQYVGIDLGTTNSAICSFDGENLQLYKSPDQHGVTPSAIFFNARGNKYVGSRAYDQAAHNPDNSATLFKRLMGTSTPIKIPAVNVTLTPEECSAEVLRVLYAYLPGSIRNDAETGTVITVPAAFNQMQKDATLSAAELAGVGKVSLMQEPVAAVMSVMRQRKTDGIFMVYDLGGGTLDIAVAQSTAGRVSLLGHGGIQMCGGRDFDRALRDSLVVPWLLQNFDLPQDFITDPAYQKLTRLAEWAIEKAKIELSTKPDTVITADESELSARDRNRRDIYLDISLTRSQFDALIEDKLKESIEAARTTMEKVGIKPHDVGRVVFVGGPTMYKPLRDKIAFELGIAGSTDVDPMTAVAAGAAVFAESIDWSSQSRGRKKSRGEIAVGGRLDVALSFIARTPDQKARVALKLGGEALPGSEFQIDSLDTGWSSGRVSLKNGSMIEVPLSKPGENTFKVFVFDTMGGSIDAGDTRFIITRTAAIIDAIPASHSIGIEAKSRAGGRATLVYIVKAGDQLPKKGTLIFKAETSLKSQSANPPINFKLWEGDIADPISDNRFIGRFAINTNDFEGVIAAGSDLVCEYEVRDSGNISLDVSVPSIGGRFHSGRNFYSRQEGMVDLGNVARQIEEELAHLTRRLDETAGRVEDERVERARERLRQAAALEVAKSNPENAGEAIQHVLEVKKTLAQIRNDHIRAIRQIDLDRVVSTFDTIRQHARPTEATAFDNLLNTAKRAIGNNSPDFETHLEQLRNRCFGILWRQDWFVIDRFNWLESDAFLFPDAAEHRRLASAGKVALDTGDIEKLRAVVSEMDSIRLTSGTDDEMMTAANIVRQ